MKIGLVDVDSYNFPNLSLMKISAYHKKLGDSVFMYQPLFHNKCDKLYYSKVFTFTPDFEYNYHENVIKGGTGYGLDNILPEEIDNIYPDYSLYNITDTAYGYLTRGCPRKCDFCIVSKKEGEKTYQAYKLEQFYNGQKYIKLLDANITASSNCIDLFNELAETKSYVDFTQGLDLRLLTDEKIQALKKIKKKYIHFAWDNMKDEKIICERLLTYIKETSSKYGTIIVYILTNYNTTLEEDLYRIYKIKEIGANPYVMIYQKDHADKVYKHLQHYVNNKKIFRTIKHFKYYKNFKEHTKNQSIGNLF